MTAKIIATILVGSGSIVSLTGRTSLGSALIGAGVLVQWWV